MAPQELFDHLTAEPFQPFQIHTASGRTFLIRHPEWAQVGKTTFTVYTPPEGDPDGPNRWEKTALILIESIAPLERPARQGQAT